MKTKWMLLGLCMLVMPFDQLGWLGVVQAQSPGALPEEARSRLEYAVGKWKSRTESLGRGGEVVKTSFSSDERKFVMGDRIVEIVGVIEASGDPFRAWEYYDVKNGKYSLTSIDMNGRVITLSGELGEQFRWTSEFVKRPDGSSYAMRFTHFDIKVDSFTALGEWSRDGGETWVPFTRQFMTRQSP